MQDKYVDSSVPRAHGPTPPWSHKCTVAFKKKDAAFKRRVLDPSHTKMLGTYSRCMKGLLMLSVGTEKNRPLIV